MHDRADVEGSAEQGGAECAGYYIHCSACMTKRMRKVLENRAVLSVLGIKSTVLRV